MIGLPCNGPLRQQSKRSCDCAMPVHEKIGTIVPQHDLDSARGLLQRHVMAPVSRTEQGDEGRSHGRTAQNVKAGQTTPDHAAPILP